MIKYITILLLCIVAFFNAAYLTSKSVNVWFETFLSSPVSNSYTFLKDWVAKDDTSRYAWFWSVYSKVSDTDSLNIKCDINETFSCSTVIKSEYSKIWGKIPFPMVAMVVYPVLWLLAIIWLIWFNTLQLLKILSFWGILFNGSFIYLETFYIKAFCPLCLLCSGIIITIFILASVKWKNS